MLRNIRICNFKVFKDAEITLGNLNLFTGLNGMGKSSFIQVLLLLRQEYLKNKGLDEELMLKGELISLGLGSDIYNTDSNSQLISFELEWDNESLVECTIDYNPELANYDILPASYKVSSKDLEELSLFNFQFEYLNALRITPAQTFPVSTHHIQHENSLGINGEYSIHYLYENQREDIKIEALAHPETKEAVGKLSLLNQVDLWMSYISPGVKLTPDSMMDYEVSSIKYSFEGAHTESKPFKSINVGFGITYALPIVLAILKANPGDLVILENPESHIHPRGQAYMGELFAKASAAGLQLIVETHSDHILNGIRVAAKRKQIDANDVGIFFFERDPDSDEHYTQITEPFLDQDGRISNWPKHFFDEWSRRLDDLIE
jgi:predicted ATPase